ncbi:hypothetical protein K445DRAFT_365229 [Daldinia sp. EC12]|nr:hypothetical protein K445DRAFT_365229 [Daldinia sp. EC12]
MSPFSSNLNIESYVELFYYPILTIFQITPFITIKSTRANRSFHTMDIPGLHIKPGLHIIGTPNGTPNDRIIVVHRYLDACSRRVERNMQDLIAKITPLVSHVDSYRIWVKEKVETLDHEIHSAEEVASTLNEFVDRADALAVAYTDFLQCDKEPLYAGYGAPTKGLPRGFWAARARPLLLDLERDVPGVNGECSRSLNMYWEMDDSWAEHFCRLSPQGRKGFLEYLIKHTATVDGRDYYKVYETMFGLQAFKDVENYDLRTDLEWRIDESIEVDKKGRLRKLLAA